DAEGVALFDQDHNQRGGGDACIGLFAPVLGNEFAFFDEPFHVAAGGEVDHRRRLAGGDRAALVTGGAERVAEADSLALRGLLEGRLQGFGVDRFRSGIADDTELGASRGASARFFRSASGRAAASATAAGDDQGDQQGEQGGDEADRHAAPPGGASVPHLGVPSFFD